MAKEKDSKNVWKYAGKDPSGKLNTYVSLSSVGDTEYIQYRLELPSTGERVGETRTLPISNVGWYERMRTVLRPTNSIIGRKAVVTDIDPESGAKSNNLKYMEKAKDQVVTIIAKATSVGEGFFLTDFFQPEFIDEKNDYIHYGFLIVETSSLTFLENA